MRPESRKRLRDARAACTELASFLATETAETFRASRRLQRAVERLLVIVGEALSIIRRLEAEVADRIPDRHRYVGLRNHLVHGYDSVNLDIVWRVATEETASLATYASVSLVDELRDTA